MIRRKFRLFICIPVFFFAFLSLPLSSAASEPQALSANNPIIAIQPKPTSFPFHYTHTDNYSFNVQSGTYAVVAVLYLQSVISLDVYNPLYFYLYSADDFTQTVSTTALQPRIMRKANWKSLGFFTIDGLNLDNDKPYSVGVKGSFGESFIIEMENGKNSSMQMLEVNTSVTSSFTDLEIIDAYQVYFESGFTYNITLDVPENISYDLFLSKGAMDEKTALASSLSDEHGRDESINSFIANETGYYCIMVTNPNCYQGSYTLDITGVEYVSNETASFSTLAVVILPLALATLVAFRKRRYFDH
ncbi:MAG: hypothetical protein ACFE95_02920 [Candidatus Hodarchaeota archaeon]